MIELNITYSKTQIDIECKGHASNSFGEKGRNILCAAVSTLIQTIPIYLDKIGKHFVPPVVTDGYFRMTLVPSPYSMIIQNVVWFVLAGVESLAIDYPEEIIVVVNHV